MAGNWEQCPQCQSKNVKKVDYDRGFLIGALFSVPLYIIVSHFSYLVIGAVLWLVGVIWSAINRRRNVLVGTGVIVFIYGIILSFVFGSLNMFSVSLIIVGVLQFNIAYIFIKTNHSTVLRCADCNMKWNPYQNAH